ncbi:MAG: hypothetical protein Q8K92_26070, partial [Leadbetterella sp.]|nr:hypothetical protein [Leadbetterella sp.]
DPSNEKTFSGLRSALLLLSNNNTINQNTRNYLLDISNEAGFIYENKELKKKVLSQHSEPQSQEH